MYLVSTFDPIVHSWDIECSGVCVHVCVHTHGLEEVVNLLQSKFHIKKNQRK